MHRVARKQYADKLLRYTVQVTARVYVYVYAYVYVRVHIHTHTCASRTNSFVQRVLFLVLFVLGVGYLLAWCARAHSSKQEPTAPQNQF